MNRMAMKSPQSLPLSLVIYRSLLVLYPSEYRREYGPHMLQLFADCYRDAYTSAGTMGVVHLWLFTLIDLVKTVLEERSRQRISLTKQLFVRLSGLAAMLGGALWITIILVTANWPRGILGGMYRRFDDPLPFVLLALLLIACGLAGAQTRQFSHSRWWGAPGSVALGIALILFSVFPLTGNWWVFYSGYMLFLLSSLYSGITMLVGCTLPRWATPLLIVGSLLCFSFNTENVRIFLGLPFGVAAIVLGVALILDKKPKPSA